MFENPKAANASGRRRMKQLGAEATATIQNNIEGLLSGLGREPTQAEVMAAEMLCSLLLAASRLRERGHSDLDVMREAALLLRETPFLQDPWFRRATGQKPAEPSA
jgi:hypothetical protein